MSIMFMHNNARFTMIRGEAVGREALRRSFGIRKTW
jgi:hypothetical protein